MDQNIVKSDHQHPPPVVSVYISSDEKSDSSLEHLLTSNSAALNYSETERRRLVRRRRLTIVTISLTFILAAAILLGECSSVARFSSWCLPSKQEVVHHYKVLVCIFGCFEGICHYISSIQMFAGSVYHDVRNRRLLESDDWEEVTCDQGDDQCLESLCPEGMFWSAISSQCLSRAGHIKLW